MDGTARPGDTARMKAILVAVAAALFAAGPVLSPFDGFDPAQFPIPQDDPPAQPAGYAFAIWGVIYAWLLVHAGAGLVLRADAPHWDRVRWPLLVALATGAVWLPVAGVSPAWATLLIWVMLAGALAALLRVPARTDWWGLRTPLALFAGWLTAASCVAVALLGAGYGAVTGGTGWAAIALALALAIAVTVQLRQRAAFEYGLAVAWGLTGIAVANLGQNLPVAGLALAGAVGIAALALSGVLRSRAA